VTAATRAALAVCACAVLAVSATARAEIERYAIVVGHDVGAADEQRLRYAQADATRVAELLTELGGVRPENEVVMRGAPAGQVRRALIGLNERIRTDQRSGRDAMLFVYYSGHGDADALHLGDTRLELRELEALVRGSSAQVRILVIDACRSGAVTRVKGGAPGPPIALSTPTELPGEGVIVLTASTSGEDAQESDLLGGSFFTHYLVSALRGAADDNGDLVVTVAEAFAYTREQTILASSRSLAGTQHPTFHYDLRGRADVALTELGTDRSLGRLNGRLTLPANATYLVMRGSLTGAVVGEIAAGMPRRTLSLPPGNYAVRGRGRDALLEGVIAVAADRETVVDPDRLARSSYARLVRKGALDGPRHVGGPFAGALVQSAIIQGASPCIGALVGGAWVGTDVTISPRLALCRGGFTNRTLDATADAAAAELRVSKVWDLPHLTLDLGVSAGGELLSERFVTRGLAPSRLTAAASLGAGPGASIALGERVFLGIELTAQTHFFSIENQAGAASMAARFALRGSLALGGWL
jgi:hypothetical protein